MFKRNCFRCGKDFDGLTRICQSCFSPKKERALNPNLSFRERQVAVLVCQAKLNKEIAYELHLNEGTIKEYLNRIFRKLNLSNRQELIIWSIKTGLFSVGRLNHKVITITPEGVAKAC